MNVFVLSLLVAAPDAAAFLERLSSADTVQASFRQEKKSPAFRIPLRSEGRVYLQSPGRLRFEYTKPGSTLILADNKLTSFHPGFGTPQTIDMTKQPELRSAFSLMLSVLRGDLKTLRNAFNLKAVDGWIELRPKSAVLAKLVQSIRLQPDAQRPVLRAVELNEPDGSHTRIDFFEIKLDQTLAATLFAVP